MGDVSIMTARCATEGREWFYGRGAIVVPVVNIVQRLSSSPSLYKRITDCHDSLFSFPRPSLRSPNPESHSDVHRAFIPVLIASIKREIAQCRAHINLITLQARNRVLSMHDDWFWDGFDFRRLSLLRKKAVNMIQLRFYSSTGALTRGHFENFKNA